MIKAECDRCGKQEETSGRAVEMVINPLLRRTEVRLPQLWHYVAEPVDDEAVEWPRRALCPECVNALRQFFQGDGAVPGLLSMEVLEVVERTGCLCPKPVEPTPPCPVHTGPPELDHDTPECPFCPLPGYQLTNEHVREEHPDRWDEWAELEGVDPRPNLTERARKITAGEMRVSEASQMIPVGQTWAVCPNASDTTCAGTYRRGEFHDHMKFAHGVPVAVDSEPCPYCPDIHPGSKLGAHIAKAHPGQWELWRSESVQRNRGGGETA